MAKGKTQKTTAIGQIQSARVFPDINTSSLISNYYAPAIMSVSPNISWQNTSSGATYSSASSLLTS